MRKLMRPVILLVAILALACTFSTKAWAILAFYEGFDYAAGDLVGNTNPVTGTDWSGVTDTVTSPGFTYDDLATTGNAVTGVSGGQSILGGLTAVQSLFAQTTGTIYLTGMISGEATRAWYKCEGPAGCTGDQSLWFQSFGGNVNVGIHGIGGEATPSLGAQAAGGAPNLVAIKIDLASGNDTVSGVLNPDLSMGEPTFTSLSSSFDLTGTDWTGFHLNSDGGVINDEFFVGTTWADVAPVPEPGSLALLALGSLALMGIRAGSFRSRRRRC